MPGFVLDELSIRCQGKTPAALVFGDGEEFLARPKSGRGWFSTAVKRAGVQKVTPHDLHTAASLAVSVGANVLAISRMLGHKDPSVTAEGVRRPVRLRSRCGGQRAGYGAREGDPEVEGLMRIRPSVSVAT